MRNKKNLVLVIVMLVMLVSIMFMLVACDITSEGGGDKPEPPIEVPPIEPPTEGDGRLEFTAEKFDGVQYNGETGIVGDMYIASLKSTIKVDQGEAIGAFAIKLVEIKLARGSFVVATAAELAKFTLLDTAMDKITTTAVVKTFRVQFGDFSAKTYYGAEFRITIEGTLSAVPAV